VQMNFDRSVESTIGVPGGILIDRTDTAFGDCLENNAGIHKVEKASEEWLIRGLNTFEA